MHTRRLSPLQIAISYLLVMALPTCAGAVPVSGPSPTPAPLPTQTIALPAVILPAAASATAAATSEPTSDLPLIPGPDVAFQDVQFRLPAELGNGVHARVAPEADKLGEPYPAYIEFSLMDYNSQNRSWEPRIQIYPVVEGSGPVKQIVQDLRELLAARPATLPAGAGIPILPVVPAGQLIDVQIRYLTFANGSGVRVLTQFAQDVGAIDNEGLVYVFQGLTNNGSYYISAFLPVTALFLPDQVDDPDMVPAVDGVSFPEYSSPNFDSEYGRYQQAVMQKLDTTSPEEFVPSLSVLDGLIESLQVETVAAALLCANTPPTRLRVDQFAYINPEPPLPNNLRREAGKNQPVTGEIQPGQAMKILEGPKCVDGWVWWKVRTLETELLGWTAEGDGQNYWLIPCSTRKECAP